MCGCDCQGDRSFVHVIHRSAPRPPTHPPTNPRINPITHRPDATCLMAERRLSPNRTGSSPPSPVLLRPPSVFIATASVSCVSRLVVGGGVSWQLAAMSKKGKIEEGAGIGGWLRCSWSIEGGGAGRGGSRMIVIILIMILRYYARDGAEGHSPRVKALDDVRGRLHLGWFGWGGGRGVVGQSDCSNDPFP